MGEEAALVEQLRKNIESRLKVSLPSDLGAALTDGVVLCHLANHVRPRSVPSIHVPSPAVPKLTMAKCRRNVENFLEACRRIGVPQTQLCLPLHILEERRLPLVAGTVRALLELAPPKYTTSPATTTSHVGQQSSTLNHGWTDTGPTLSLSECTLYGFPTRPPTISPQP
ncbi:DISP complex protein LRCH3-like isoform X1 [Salvelinus fontinalis]|uniref:DISP complex protein LRCH3-like isoform X1 n=1 Tax=Salvelinus fontinalis TaxID=8038 RepID=UPI002484F089|nr:DISP complex protein LRCH3-like isoform X1 [Salvelinus fontinalis]